LNLIDRERKMIRYKCRKCGTQLETSDTLSGQIEACPVCQQSQTVPEPEATNRLYIVWGIVGASAILLAVIIIAWFALSNGGQGEAGIYPPDADSRAATESPPLDKKAMDRKRSQERERQIKEAEEVRRNTERKRKAAKKAIVAELSSLKQRVNIRIDKPMGITWITPKGNLTPCKSGDDSLYISPYIGFKAPAKLWPRFSVTYNGEDWIFTEQVIAMANGKRIDIPLNRYKDVDSDAKGTGVWESIDIEDKDNIAKIISQATEVYISLSGKTRRTSWELSDADIQRFKDVAAFLDLGQKALDMGLNPVVIISTDQQ
jgi:hypothetical protein